MDHIHPPPALDQNQDQDSPMQGQDIGNNHSDLIQNGFINPEVLLPLEHQNGDPDSVESQDPSRYSSQQSSETGALVLQPRQFLPTGCCYDDRMKCHANADFSASPAHPEDPRRIEAIMKEFKDAGLVYTGTSQELQDILKDSPTKWMWRIPARRAEIQEICLVHGPAHYQWVRETSMMSSQQLRDMTNDFDNGRKSLYIGGLTFEAALISAGGAIETCKNVVSGRVKNAIAIIRPPGHHAEPNESMGFCIFNNVPIAARVCMADYPNICRKVLILDWDVHHGNGIQTMFYEDPNVLYISLHVYKDGLFYPGQPDEDGMPDGGLDSVGVGAGIGKNINIGWHDQGMGDGEYMAAFQKIVMPIAQEFDPDLVIVSAGFDAAAGDDLGGCWVSPACYSHMTHMLMSLAEGRVAVCLEGGYNLKAISRSALAVAKTLMGEAPPRITIPKINARAAETLENVKRIHSRHWECMKSGIVPFPELRENGAQRASDVLRTAQQHSLEANYSMIPLIVRRDKMTEFDNQVLITPELMLAKKILMIMHDPPDLLAQPDPLNNTVLAHNAWVNDGVAPYIDWAIENGFGVMDINFPQHHIEAELGDIRTLKIDTIEKHTKELLCYIWDNYLEMTRASISILSVGDCSVGIRQLLSSRNAKSKITGVLSYQTGTLSPIKSETDPSLSKWYKDNSLIYVSPSHACWSDEEASKKVRKKRFGHVEKSDVAGLRNMMGLYMEAGTDWIAGKTEEWEALNGSESESDEFGGREFVEEEGRMDME